MRRLSPFDAALIASIIGMGALSLLLKRPKRPQSPEPSLELINPYDERITPEQRAEVEQRLKDLRARIVAIRKQALDTNDYYLSLYAIHLEDETDAVEAEYLEQFGRG